MKKRYGFVSNSSASSFIVRYLDVATQDGFRQQFITNEEVNFLESAGWFKTNTLRSADVVYNPEELDSFDPRFPVNYGKDVIVNQDDVILFLLEHNISFTGTCHYGDETVIFNKDSEYFYKFHNIGRLNEIEISYRYKDPESVIEDNESTKHYEKINVKEWIAENQWLKE